MRSSRKAFRSVCLLAMLAMAITGCARKAGSLLDTKLLSPLNDSLEQRYLNPQVLDNYWQDMKNNVPPDKLKARRNEIIFGLMAYVDYDYQQYELNLSMHRRTTDTIFDLGLLGINAATTVSGGEGAKSVLAAIATGVTGTRISLDKNLFFEKSTPSLLYTMRASRTAKKLEIKARLREQSVAEYPIELALMDVLEYYTAGTLTGAIVTINQEAAARAQTIENQAR